MKVPVQSNMSKWSPVTFLLQPYSRLCCNPATCLIHITASSVALERMLAMYFLTAF